MKKVFVLLELLRLLTILSGACFLVACNQDATKVESQVNELQKEIAHIHAVLDEHAREQFGGLYFLSNADNADKSGYFAAVHSARSINTGEVLRLADDLWSVQAVQVFTEETSKGGEYPTYNARYTHLVVKFLAKAQTTPSVPKTNQD